MEKFHRKILRRKFSHFTDLLAYYIIVPGIGPTHCYDYLLFGHFLEGKSSFFIFQAHHYHQCGFK